MAWDNDGQHEDSRRMSSAFKCRMIGWQGRSQVASEEQSEDWPVLSFLIAGLAFAIVANTFIGLIPG